MHMVFAVLSLLVNVCIAPTVLQGKRLYDALYRAGYGSMQSMMHARPLIDYMQRNLTSEVHSVLDVGCSVGMAVHALWDLGIVASGVDISSVATAEARRRQGTGLCVKPCFQQASVLQLPFADRSFDAILSSDVLEHVDEADVARAIAELTRVARQYLILKISNRHEGVRMNRTRAPVQESVGGGATFGDRVRAEGDSVLPSSLHLTVHGQLNWWRRFDKSGFVLASTIRVPRYSCCAFVLRRKLQ